MIDYKLMYEEREALDSYRKTGLKIGYIQEAYFEPPCVNKLLKNVTTCSIQHVMTHCKYSGFLLELTSVILEVLM